MTPSDTPPTSLLTSLLRDVSRSFYLTLRVLPAAVRPQIGLAYLLARATDTIADTDIVPVSERLDTLDRLRGRISGTLSTKLDLSCFLKQPTSIPSTPSEFQQRADSKKISEQLLLRRMEDALAILQMFSAEDQRLIREVLATITSGQELDLRRFGGISSAAHGSMSNDIVALGSDAELEDYTYRVAGCVGEFWTKICRAHLFPAANLDGAALLQRGVRFGQGLQLVNILRDFSADLKIGRCYLPSEKLAGRGLKPSDLRQEQNESRLRPVHNFYLDRAEGYLAEGWVYTNTVPYRCARVRLACAWPVLIGMKTVAKLRSAGTLYSEAPIKISRRELRNLVVRSIVVYPFSGVWRGLFHSLKFSPAKPIASKADFQ